MTAVLIGSQTYARRWVHYEVMKSIERGNGLLAIHINSVRDKSGQTKVAGPNPLDYLGIEVSTDGATGTPTMWDGSRWVYYGDLGAFSINVQPHDKRGKNLQLKMWFPTYDWVADDGFNNFGSWVA